MIYECHITVPLLSHRFAEMVASNNPGWKTSEIARDPILGENTYFYLTAHDDNLLTLYSRMKAIVGELRGLEVPIIREKIELTIYDERGTNQ